MTQELAAIDQPDELLQAVVRAAADPNTDPARLREFLAIGRELQLDRSKGQYNIAFVAMKKDLPVIAKNGVVMNKSGRLQFKYARYDDLHEGIGPTLEKYGFATSFNFEEPAPGRLTCVLELSHTGGYSKFFRWTLPSTGENQFVTNLQNAAAARTFAKRCVLIDALDILTQDSDRDGAPTEAPERITEEQARKIEDAIAAIAERDPKFREKFRTWLQVELKVGDIRELFQGGQCDRVMMSLKGKMEGLGIK